MFKVSENWSMTRIALASLPQIQVWKANQRDAWTILLLTGAKHDVFWPYFLSHPIVNKFYRYVLNLRKCRGKRNKNIIRGLYHVGMGLFRTGLRRVLIQELVYLWMSQAVPYFYILYEHHESWGLFCVLWVLLVLQANLKKTQWKRYPRKITTVKYSALNFVRRVARNS